MFLINLHGKDTIYEQIRNQILRFIETGILNPDDKLPSVRTLANELGINPNTVQKAYQELEKDGYIYTLNKKGAFIAKKDTSYKDEILIKHIHKTIKHYKTNGISKDTLINIINEEYKEEKSC